MTKGVVSEGGDLHLRRITSSPSQTLRRRLVRTTDDGRRRECSARCLPPFVAALFFTLRDSYGWQHCRPVCSEARYSSRIAFFAYSTCIRRPRWNIAIPFGMEKPEWLGYPMVKKFEDICIRFDATHERDRHTDTHTPHDGIGALMHRIAR